MAQRNLRALTLSVAGAAALLSLARGCTSAGSSERPRSDGGTRDGGSGGVAISSSSASTTSTSTSGSGGSGGTDAGPPLPMPCPNWPGWETWDDFAASCPLCVPASKDALPAPIQWEACDPRAGMPTGCRQMKVDWPYHNTAFAYTATVDVRADGTVALDIIRMSGIGSNPYRIKMVADADGPVHSAFLDPRGEGIKGCTFFLSDGVSVAQGKYVMQVVDGDVVNKFPQAAVGGAIDDLHPTVQWTWGLSGDHGFTASDVAWATWDSSQIGIAMWGQPWHVAYSTQQDGLQQTSPKAWHDFISWEASDGVYMGLMAWTPAKGPYPFITFPGDWTRGANALGTDGVNMVWFYGEGKTQPSGTYPKASVMSAPFTTDPAALQPKRLRSFPASLQPVSQWIVGCGYAAIEYVVNHVLVVRLSDGWSWEIYTLPTGDAGPLDRWNFSTVYGLTCDEVWLRGGVGLEMNIARVRLDALGPGMAPD